MAQSSAVLVKGWGIEYDSFQHSARRKTTSLDEASGRRRAAKLAQRVSAG